jgi:predicted RNA polymerase sigma factor
LVERGAVDASLESVLREERTRLTAGLVRILGDWEAAEELVQDAAVAALEHWPAEGVPRNPGAWLMATAKRRAIDHWRRARHLQPSVHCCDRAHKLT